MHEITAWIYYYSDYLKEKTPVIGKNYIVHRNHD